MVSKPRVNVGSSETPEETGIGRTDYIRYFIPLAQRTFEDKNPEEVGRVAMQYVPKGEGERYKRVKILHKMECELYADEFQEVQQQLRTSFTV
jgi:hypothetical protein